MQHAETDCAQRMRNLSIANDRDRDDVEGVKFIDYRDESQLESLMDLVGRDLSEPYSIFTYRYFLHSWPQLCTFAVCAGTDDPIGCVVCKIDSERRRCGTPPPPPLPTTTDDLRDEDDEDEDDDVVRTGYLAMLAVDKDHRRSGVGSALVRRVVRRMRDLGCESVTLETEVSNRAAMRLYEDKLGFVREELLVRYYLNWGDAYRLRLWLTHDDDDDSVHEGRP